MSPRLIIIDSTAMFGELLKEYLENLSGSLRVAGLFADGLAARKFCEQHPIDLVITGLAVPGIGGRSLCEALLKLSAPPKIIVLSSHLDDESAAELIRVGVNGLVDRAGPLSALKNAVDQVLRGGMAYSLGRFTNLSDLVQKKQKKVPLSLREREILQLIAEGHRTKEIGYMLSISPRTVEKHRENLKKKLGINETAALIRYAVACKMVYLEGGSEPEPVKSSPS